MHGGQGLSPEPFFFLGDMLTAELLQKFGFSTMKGLSWGEEDQRAVRFWRGWKCSWGETQQLRACVSASKECIPEGTFPITVVALCHLAVSPKLPGEQHKGELSGCGLGAAGCKCTELPQ